MKTYCFIFYTEADTPESYSDLIIIINAKADEIEDSIIERAAASYFDHSGHRRDRANSSLWDHKYFTDSDIPMISQDKKNLGHIKSLIAEQIKKGALMSDGQEITYCRFKTRTVAMAYGHTDITHMPQTYAERLLQEMRE